MPEQTLGEIPLGLGMVMKINFLNFHVPICCPNTNSRSSVVWIVVVTPQTLPVGF